MDRRKPLCGSAGPYGNRGVHGPHSFWSHGYTAWTECPGWSEQDADATVLADRLDEVARDHAWPLKMPPGIRLECHPLVPHVLHNLFVPSYAEFVSSLRTGEDALKPQIPVAVTAGMEAGQWRIVTDDGLIAEGVVRA